MEYKLEILEKFYQTCKVTIIFNKVNCKVYEKNTTLLDGFTSSLFIVPTVKRKTRIKVVIQ